MGGLTAATNAKLRSLLRVGLRRELFELGFEVSSFEEVDSAGIYVGAKLGTAIHILAGQVDMSAEE